MTQLSETLNQITTSFDNNLEQLIKNGLSMFTTEVDSSSVTFLYKFYYLKKLWILSII